jgi:hypothetical protein
MRLLVLAPEPVDAAAVRAALPGHDLADAEVFVVTPALNESGLRFWMSDADDAIDRAHTAQQETVAALRDEGARARGAAGESEPLLALQDALATFPADRILVFRRTGDDAYREEDLDGARERFGIPVDERPLPG